jgi:hypothetical protein
MSTNGEDSEMFGVFWGRNLARMEEGQDAIFCSIEDANEWAQSSGRKRWRVAPVEMRSYGWAEAVAQ